MGSVPLPLGRLGPLHVEKEKGGKKECRGAREEGEMERRTRQKRKKRARAEGRGRKEKKGGDGR